MKKEGSCALETLGTEGNVEFITEDVTAAAITETKTIIKEAARGENVMTQENMFGLNNKLTYTGKRNEVRKSGPGRPPRQHALRITELIKEEDLSLYTKEEIKSLKYQRMRDLNNEASKKSRAARRDRHLGVE